MCVENDQLKIYGAGLLSSVAELKHVVQGIRNSKVTLERFTVDEAYNTQCVVTSFQKRYFYTNTIDEAKEELRYGVYQYVKIIFSLTVISNSIIIILEN